MTAVIPISTQPLAGDTIITGTFNSAFTASCAVSGVNVKVNGGSGMAATLGANTWSLTLPGTVNGDGHLRGDDAITVELLKGACSSSGFSAPIYTKFKAPTLTGPITSSQTTASGTVLYANNGATIQLYDNGVALGSTTTVTAGVWSRSGLDLSLLAGHVITAKAVTTLSHGADSNASNPYTVDGGSSLALPDNQSTTDWTDMTGNVLLMHLDETPAVDGTVIYDTSGNLDNGVLKLPSIATGTVTLCDQSWGNTGGCGIASDPNTSYWMDFDSDTKVPPNTATADLSKGHGVGGGNNCCDWYVWNGATQVDTGISSASVGSVSCGPLDGRVYTTDAVYYAQPNATVICLRTSAGAYVKYTGQANCCGNITLNYYPG